MKRKALMLISFFLFYAAAAYSQDTYVFPSDGFRYTQQGDETVLTRTNLNQHTELLAEMGTTVDAVRSSYLASGIVMEIIPSSGNQVSIGVSANEEMDNPQEAKDLTADDKERLLQRFDKTGMYESAAWSVSLPEWLRLTTSAMYDALPVWQLRYVTLHLGRFYTVCETVIGRELTDEDDEQVEKVIQGMKLLSIVVQPTATPTPMASMTPAVQPTATPEPIKAQIISGELGIDEINGVTNDPEVILTGHTYAGKKLVVRESDKTLGTATVGRDGRFTVRLKLLHVGENKLSIACDEALAELSIIYEIAPVDLTITEPANTTFTGERILVRGVTAPNATVYVTGEKTNTNVKANRNGVFTAPIFIAKAGTFTFKLRAHLAGKTDTTKEVALTRVLTEREELSEFKAQQVAVTYRELADDPLAYAGKRFVFRGKVAGYTDYDGSPCALVLVSNPQTGVWRDPLYAVLSVGDDIDEGDVITLYLVGQGITLPASGEFTVDGQEMEAPVAKVFRWTSNR